MLIPTGISVLFFSQIQFSIFNFPFVPFVVEFSLFGLPTQNVIEPKKFIYYDIQPHQP